MANNIGTVVKVQRTFHVELKIEVDVPEDATHYAGDLDDEDGVQFYKRKQIIGYPYWCCFNRLKNTWMIEGEDLGNYTFLKELPTHSVSLKDQIERLEAKVAELRAVLDKYAPYDNKFV